MRERQTVVVESEGVIRLPESLREQMDLRPGDILSVEGSPPDFLWLAPYRGSPEFYRIWNRSLVARTR
jgi:bifunctional DNA-binding transcriptional regulator/antitoxin component of YhaV-PrlF toxin-antitoxin module